MLKVDKLSKYILKDISFELKENQDLIILGSNGAGKTTLAKLLCGLLDSNKIKIKEKEPSSLFNEERTNLINYIPPKLEVFDEFITVYEYLELNHIHSKQSIETILSELCILHLKDKSCKSLSSGESQLLLLAGALLHNSIFTIFDEITANLDPIRLKEVFDILKDKSHLKSKIIITHNLQFAYKLGFDILYIQNGENKFYGSSKDFFEQKNLDKLFVNRVKKVDENIVVDL